ncbi:MAG: hypothetical protein NG737_07335 [Omnitrophica bacterium]|nr:hypothetical protein [Candidatus Omnitrophota bacterium]
MSRKTAIIFLIIIFSFFCGSAFSQDNNKELADIWFQIGVKFYDIGYYQDAVDRFKTCLSFNPGHKGAKKYLDLIGQSRGKAIVNTSQEQETGSILEESVKEIEKVVERYTVLDAEAERIEKVVERYTAVDMGVETIKKIQKQAKFIRGKLISKALDDAVIEIDI